MILNLGIRLCVSISRGSFRVKDVQFGYIELKDGSIIIQRVAVVDVRVLTTKSPFGVEFDVSITTGIAVRASDSVSKLLENKRILSPGEKPPDAWKTVDIVKSVPAVEEVLFEDEQIGKYLIRIEIEPIMVSLNLEVKTLRGEPLYAVRWVPKVSWKKIGE